MTDITIRNGQVLHAFYTGTLASGVTTAFDAVRMADETGVHVLDRQVLGNGAACALYLGDVAAAGDLLKRMESSLREGWGWKEFDIGYFHLLRGWQKSQRNDFSAASQHLEMYAENLDANVRCKFWRLTFRGVFNRLDRKKRLPISGFFFAWKLDVIYYL